MKHELQKKIQRDPGSQGRPKWYPIPPKDEDLLFYIQRNQNQNTIVYRVNRTLDGLINEHLPMDAYWTIFSEGGARKELNHLQNSLAFGYNSNQISKDLYQFTFVSYEHMTFYIQNLENRGFKVIYINNGQHVVLKNIYVYAVEFGVFPDVKYIEFFGENLNSGESDYMKITIE